MKKFIWVAVTAVLFLPLSAYGAEFGLKDSYLLRQGETLGSNLYVVGEGALIQGILNGDLISAGGKVSISGTVNGDVVFVGGDAEVSGTVNGDFRAGAGTVIITGNITGDLLVGSGNVNVLPGAVIGGDVFAGAGRLKIDGRVLGAVRASAGEANIGGEVVGDVNLNSGKVYVGESSKIGGNLNYTAPKEAEIASGAEMGGVNFTKRKTETGGAAAAGGFWTIGKFLTLLIAGLLLIKFFKGTAKFVVSSAIKEWQWNIARGFAFMILTPVVVIILFVTLLGIPFAMALLMVYVLTLMAASVFMVVTLGALLEKWITKKDMHLTWKTVLWGAVAGTILAWIPVLGWLAVLLIYLSALGGMMQMWRKEIWSKREISQ